MRYSTEHKEETRRRIVQAAVALAKKQGFGTTGVDGLMGACITLSGGLKFGLNDLS